MKVAGAALIAAGIGFLLGFLWGNATKESLPAATETDVSGGILTLRVNLKQALTAGALRLFQ